MRKFKDFIRKKKIEPILITAIPVHGKHAKTKKPMKKSLKESHDISTHTWYQHGDNDHLGNSIHEVDAKLHHNDQKWLDHGPTFHKHMQHYTEDSSSLNTPLIHHARDGKALYADKHDAINHLQNHLHSHSLDHDLHVYHGTYSWHPGNEASKHPERKVKLPTFVSSSINKETAHGFASRDDYGEGDDIPASKRHVLHIHLKKGDPGMYIGRRSSVAKNEHEYVIPHSTVFKIHPKPTKLTDGTHVWHAHVDHGD